MANAYSVPNNGPSYPSPVLFSSNSTSLNNASSFAGGFDMGLKFPTPFTSSPISHNLLFVKRDDPFEFSCECPQLDLRRLDLQVYNLERRHSYTLVRGSDTEPFRWSETRPQNLFGFQPTNVLLTTDLYRKPESPSLQGSLFTRLSVGCRIHNPGIYSYTCRCVDEGHNLSPIANFSLLVWGEPGTPSAPLIKPPLIYEGHQFTATCKADVGYPFGYLQLVSSGAPLNDDFVHIPEGCGAQESPCYRYNRQPYEMQRDRYSSYSWPLPQANVSFERKALKCRVVHDYYSDNEKLFSNSSLLRVLYPPRDINLYTLNGGLIPSSQTRLFMPENMEFNWIDCIANGNPTPNYTWFSREETKNFPRFNMSGSRLSFFDLKVPTSATNARATFMCEAKNIIQSKLEIDRRFITIEIQRENSHFYDNIPAIINPLVGVGMLCMAGCSLYAACFGKCCTTKRRRRVLTQSDSNEAEMWVGDDGVGDVGTEPHAGE